MSTPRYESDLTSTYKQAFPVENPKFLSIGILIELSSIVFKLVSKDLTKIIFLESAIMTQIFSVFTKSKK